VSIEEQHIALPKLYGAPAYARPQPVPVATAPRPFDPDDLPIEAFQTEEDRAIASNLPARAWAPGGVIVDSGSNANTDAGHAPRGPHARPFNLRSIAGRLLGGD
jgi:hypothetical protein